MLRTGDLTSKADGLFERGDWRQLRHSPGTFYELAGGFDESFTQWGGEDTEFGYRAFTRGALLVPLRDAFAWHQGSWQEG